MLKTHCPHHTSDDSKSGVVCPRCGGRLPPADATEVMLQTLAQLAQFGLDAEARTLLEGSAEDA